MQSARLGNILIGGLALVGAAFAVLPAGALGSVVNDVTRVLPPSPPLTPKGLPACAEPLAAAPAPRAGRQGEHIEYDLEIMGIEVGTFEVGTARQGSFHGEPVTEYRGELRVDRLLAALVPLEGTAAALVSEAELTPVQAQHRYRWATLSASEFQTFAEGAREVETKRKDKDGHTEKRRRFHAPVQDMLSGFYFLRRVPDGLSGCSIISANGKAYTVWLAPEGRETLSTTMGKREAMRYHVRYASDDAKVVKHARIWVGTDGRRIPYKAEALNRYHPMIALKSYRPGK